MGPVCCFSPGKKTILQIICEEIGFSPLYFNHKLHKKNQNGAVGIDKSVE